MHVPPVTHPCWHRLAEGHLRLLNTGHRPTELMIQRLTASRDPVRIKAAEIFSYFSKWGEDLPFEVAQIHHL